MHLHQLSRRKSEQSRFCTSYNTVSEAVNETRSGAHIFAQARRQINYKMNVRGIGEARSRTLSHTACLHTTIIPAGGDGDGGGARPTYGLFCATICCASSMSSLRSNRADPYPRAVRLEIASLRAEEARAGPLVVRGNSWMIFPRAVLPPILGMLRTLRLGVIQPQMLL